MSKKLHAVEKDGTTFGMEIDGSSEAYKRFKKQIIEDYAVSYFGDECKLLQVPYLALASIMREAHWLVSERKAFVKFKIDGLQGDEEIYVNYGEKLDFRPSYKK